MSSWERKVSADGRVIWINEEVGNVVQVSDGAYISMMAVVLTLGPFGNLDDAKTALEGEKTKAKLEELMTQVNDFVLGK
jgi:hypothetical protein